MTAVCAYVGLGANMGKPQAVVEQAIAALARLPKTQLRARSRLYRSAPVDSWGDDYINAVAELSTALSPLELLAQLQAIEQAHGRQRGQLNAPRTLDLDLLLYGELLLNTPVLTLPHPRLHLRAFVLAPLLELAPQLQVPGLGAAAAWRARCAQQRVEPLS